MIQLAVMRSIPAPFCRKKYVQYWLLYHTTPSPKTITLAMRT